MYSKLVPNVPKIGSESTSKLIRMKWLLKINELLNKLEVEEIEDEVEEGGGGEKEEEEEDEFKTMKCDGILDQHDFSHKTNLRLKIFASILKCIIGLKIHIHVYIQFFDTQYLRHTFSQIY